MPGSRNVVLLSIASVLVFMFAAIGWCGGPVAARAPGGPQYGMPPGPTGEGGVVPGNLSLAGSLGSGTASGSNALSPAVTYESLNFTSNVVWGARGRFEPQLFGLDFAINGDILHTHLSGSTSSWSGPPHDVLGQNQGASGDLYLTIISVTGDIGLGSALMGANTGIRIAPRLGWTHYSDKFKLENTTTGLSDSKPHDHDMFTAGIAGQIDLGQLSGYGGYNSPIGTASPVLGFSAAIGAGGDMRFYNWEVFLKIFQMTADNYAMFNYATFDGPFASMTLPTIQFEIAWIRYTFDQTVGEEDIRFALAGPISEQTASYRIDIPTIRGVVTF